MLYQFTGLINFGVLKIADFGFQGVYPLARGGRKVELYRVKPLS